MVTQGKMSYEKVRDILESIQQTNGRVLTHLDGLEVTSDEQTYQLLVDQVKSHQQVLQQQMRSSQFEEPESILDTWIQYVPEEQLENTAAEIMQLGGDSLEELAEKVLAYMNAVTAFLSTIAEQSSSDEVQEFLSSLAVREQKAVEEYAKSLLGLRDV